MQIRRSNKQIAIVLFSFFVVLPAVFILFVLLLISAPPKESIVIKNFYAHRAAYEQLRDMLLVDKELTVVADWGIETSDSRISKMPPEGGLSVSRYRKYLALFREIGARMLARVSRGEEEPPEIRVLIWGSGFAGDTRHVAVSWLDHAPLNTVGSLDDFYKTPKPRNPVYRHIDGHWYIWADW